MNDYLALALNVTGVAVGFYSVGTGLARHDDSYVWCGAAGLFLNGVAFALTCVRLRLAFLYRTGQLTEMRP